MHSSGSDIKRNDSLNSSKIEKLDSYLRKFTRKNITSKQKLKLWFYTLFYHYSYSYEYVIDTVIEPVYWIVDHFTHLLGPAFVVIVVALVGSIVVIGHFVGIPFWYQKSPTLFACLVVIGYWILINLVFNFFQTATVSPGLPTDAKKLSTCSVAVCKKCINPKAPRVHHCSICNKCYLNMDHHCPWVNNCIGHFNRRYFFLTMTYIVIGCCFIMLFGVELAFREIIMEENILPDCSDGAIEVSQEKDIFQENINEKESMESELSEELHEGCNEDIVVLFLEIKIARRSLRLLLYFAGLLSIGTSLALGGLSIWHAKLITEGETSIEYHSNRSERKKNKAFVNIYDLGKKQNWKVLLGLDQPNVTFLRNILFPSTHLPTGDGYDFTHVTTLHKQNSSS